jgi:hypothetical protein
VLRFLADESFHGAIVDGLHLHYPQIDIIRAQDLEIAGAGDPVLLDWAAQNGRVLLTHDVATVTRDAYDRVRAGLPTPGVFEASQDLPIGLAIEEIAMLAECSVEGEWEGQVRYLPL